MQRWNNRIMVVRVLFSVELAVLEVCLAIICYYLTRHVDLWIRKESWTKVLLVPNFEDPSRKKSCMPIFMSKDGKFLFRYWKSMAISDPMMKSVTYPLVCFMNELWEMMVAVDSLVLVNDHDSKGPVKKTRSLIDPIVQHLEPNQVV
ncbi:OLC1v1024147C1 [Oldenlandia corymbosa var. corymbosa]|uniref:OLC1v1024147C1 n=1 Tax=Oldenlandia corymbosa var. corymbosa TaxID=529605 RepID=A0AAV1C2J2_OLDCO|nr:OLC1v1024147C1 [Oldenlandia corymbosa var. corymbosa]